MFGEKVKYSYVLSFTIIYFVWNKHKTRWFKNRTAYHLDYVDKLRSEATTIVQKATNIVKNMINLCKRKYNKMFGKLMKQTNAAEKQAKDLETVNDRF